MEINNNIDIGSSNVSSLLFDAYENAIQAMQQELTDHKSKLRDLRTTASRYLRHGEVQRLNNLEEEVNDFKTWMERHKEKVEGLTRILNEMEMQFGELRLQSFSEFEEGYDEKLREKIRSKKEEAKEGRQKHYKSFTEMLQRLNQTDREERNAFNAIKAVVISSGIHLSSLLLDYFLLISRSEPSYAMERKIEDVMNMIQSESLEGNSIIIDMFVSVMEVVGREMRTSTYRKGIRANKDNVLIIKKENVSYEKRENDLLGMIFFEIFNLEIVFSRPVFLMRSAHKEILLNIGKNIGKSFRMKLARIKLKMKELKKVDQFASFQVEHSETNKIKERLELEIEERWYKLSFSKQLIINNVESSHIN